MVVLIFGTQRSESERRSGASQRCEKGCGFSRPVVFRRFPFEHTLDIVLARFVTSKSAPHPLGAINRAARSLHGWHSSKKMPNACQSATKKPNLPIEEPLLFAGIRDGSSDKRESLRSRNGLDPARRTPDFPAAKISNSITHGLNNRFVQNRCL